MKCEPSYLPAVPCLRETLNRERLLLLGRLPGEPREYIVQALPSLDAELMLRAQDAMERGQFARAAALLDGMEDSNTPRWKLLRGRCYLTMGEFAKAIPNLLNAEEAYPAPAISGLEQCYRELGDFENAYRCACKLREL